MSQPPSNNNLWQAAQAYCGSSSNHDTADQLARVRAIVLGPVPNLERRSLVSVSSRLITGTILTGTVMVILLLGMVALFRRTQPARETANATAPATGTAVTTTNSPPALPVDTARASLEMPASLLAAITPQVMTPRAMAAPEPEPVPAELPTVFPAATDAPVTDSEQLMAEGTSRAEIPTVSANRLPASGAIQSSGALAAAGPTSTAVLEPRPYAVTVDPVQSRGAAQAISMPPQPERTSLSALKISPPPAVPASDRYRHEPPVAQPYVVASAPQRPPHTTYYVSSPQTATVRIERHFYKASKPKTPRPVTLAQPVRTAPMYYNIQASSHQSGKPNAGGRQYYAHLQSATPPAFNPCAPPPPPPPPKFPKRQQNEHPARRHRR